MGILGVSAAGGCSLAGLTAGTTCTACVHVRMYTGMAVINRPQVPVFTLQALHHVLDRV